MPKRILRAMQILELSAVDNPAQEGARFVLAKRHEPDEPYWKRDFSQQQREHAARSGAAMPDGSFPIENEQDLHNAITAWGRANKEDRKAVARHIRSRAEALGLTDTLPTEGELANAMGRGKSADKTGEDVMTEAEKLAKAEKDLLEANAKVEKLAKVAALTDVEKAHYDGLVELDAEGADKFLDMSKDERLGAIEKAKNSDPVIYTDSEGHEYHKSEAKAAALAKRADETAKENATLKAAQATVEIEKRCGDLFKHLKGDMPAKVALLKAVDGIGEVATRDAVMEMLKANDAGLGEALKTLGTQTGATVSEPEAKLNKMAEDYMAAHKAEGMTFAKAYDIVAQTPEGSALYKELYLSKMPKAAA